MHRTARSWGFGLQTTRRVSADPRNHEHWYSRHTLVVTSNQGRVLREQFLPGFDGRQVTDRQEVPFQRQRRTTMDEDVEPSFDAFICKPVDNRKRRWGHDRCDRDAIDLGPRPDRHRDDVVAASSSEVLRHERCQISCCGRRRPMADDLGKHFSEPVLMERGPLPLLLCRQQDRATPALNLPTLSGCSDRGRNLPDRHSWLQRLDIPRVEQTRAS
jgi:hypothetical protein